MEQKWIFNLSLSANSSSSRSHCRWKKRSVCVACELEQHRKCVRGCSRWCVAALFKSERNSCETTMAMNIFVHFISLHCPMFLSLFFDFELELTDIGSHSLMILRRVFWGFVGEKDLRDFQQHFAKDLSWLTNYKSKLWMRKSCETFTSKLLNNLHTMSIVEQRKDFLPCNPHPTFKYIHASESEFIDWEMIESERERGEAKGAEAPSITRGRQNYAMAIFGEINFEWRNNHTRNVTFNNVREYVLGNPMCCYK